MSELAPRCEGAAELLKDYPTARLEGIEGVPRDETVAQYVEPILREPTFEQISTDEPQDLRFPVRMAWRSPADLQALGRTFLSPDGSPPEELKDCFLTQSAEVIECRRLEDGLPVWRVELEMIPGIEMGNPESSPSRPGRRALAGKAPDPSRPSRHERPRHRFGGRDCSLARADRSGEGSEVREC
jgi:hypothetical protein